jgi:multiple sugar transport system permease protein
MSGGRLTVSRATRSSVSLRHSRSAFRRIYRAVIYTAITIGAVIMLFPIFYMVTTSLKPLGLVYAWPPVWIPDPPLWRNYVEALTIMPFGLFFRNTLIITVSCMVGRVFISSLVGYAFARLRSPGRDALFILVLATLMLPGQVTLIPHYVIYRNLGWIDTFLPLIVGSYLGGGAFNIFLTRQFFLGIPLELDDAAKIDGCGPMRIWADILLPLSKPVMATVGIFTFMGEWNNFFDPLIYLHSNDKATLALALMFFKGQFSTETHLLMAASVAMLVPMLIVFFSAQRVFVRGITFTGLTG